MKINQSDTAIANYYGHVLPHCQTKQQRAIIERMKPWKDYTIGELSWWTKMDKSTVSARRNELLKLGVLVYGPKRKCMFSEKLCQTVRISEAIK